MAFLMAIKLVLLSLASGNWENLILTLSKSNFSCIFAFT
uniref:Uncharacterized protein n=2 Tax=Enterobacteriaceae TaxID=543 RepID=A0A7G5F5B4_ECOLX|nr:hypothetical protein [Citrobacter freundii]QMV81439.1 hypothetical protein [Escherichia coli]WKV18187.1 hypothetical protein [Escherichia coli]